MYGVLDHAGGVQRAEYAADVSAGENARVRHYHVTGNCAGQTWPPRFSRDRDDGFARACARCALIGGVVTEWFGYTGFSYPGMEEMATNFQFAVAYSIRRHHSLTLFLGPTIVFVGGMLAAIYPALRLHWLHPVEAMRAAP